MATGTWPLVIAESVLLLIMLVTLPCVLDRGHEQEMKRVVEGVALHALEYASEMRATAQRFPGIR